MTQLVLTPLEELDFVKEISEHDWMGLGQEPDWYYKRGYWGLSIVVSKCIETGITPKRILDFGCGHGCVARMFKAQFKDAEVIGQDVNEEWLAFCHDVIGIETQLSEPRVADVTLKHDAIDVIWLGSVFTHITTAAAQHLFSIFHEALSPGGLLIFTTSGQSVVDTFAPGKEPFLEIDEANKAMKDFEEKGYGFAPYNAGNYVDWGRSLGSYQWYADLAESNNFKIISFDGPGWGNQDVYCLQK